MTAIAEQDLTQVDLGDLALWADGPPHELFTRLRREAPVHWSPLADHPGESGFWSITRAEDLRGVSLDWETYSSELGGVLVLDDFGIPLEAQRQQMISMDPPRHDRIKALFQRGFTPAADRRARDADPGDRQPGNRSGRRPGGMRPGAGRRRTRRRSGDRVIHRDPGGGRPAPHRADQHRARVRRRGPSARPSRRWSR